MVSTGTQQLAVFYYSRKYRIQILISMSEQVKSQEEFLANFNWHNFEEVLM
jgi:hypothetical protein